MQHHPDKEKNHKSVPSKLCVYCMQPYTTSRSFTLINATSKNEDEKKEDGNPWQKGFNTNRNTQITNRDWKTHIEKMEKEFKALQ